MYNLPSINILNGNLFSCGLNDSARAATLPVNDPTSGTYSCGSNLANVTIFFWLVACLAVASIVTLAYRLLNTSKLASPSPSSRESNLSEEMASVNCQNISNLKNVENNSSLANSAPATSNPASSNITKKIETISRNPKTFFLYYLNELDNYLNVTTTYLIASNDIASGKLREFAEFMNLLRRYSLVLILLHFTYYILCYSLLHVSYATHEFIYAWVISAAYLSGEISGIVLLFSLIISMSLTAIISVARTTLSLS
jgi:hypothetical protein